MLLVVFRYLFRILGKYKWKTDYKLKKCNNCTNIVHWNNQLNGRCAGSALIVFVWTLPRWLRVGAALTPVTLEALLTESSAKRRLRPAAPAVEVSISVRSTLRGAWHRTVRRSVVVRGRLVLRPTEPGASRGPSTPREIRSVYASTSVRCVRRPFDRLPGRTGYLRCLVPLLTRHDSKLHRLSVTHWTNRFTRVVSSYSRLVHEYILTRVGPVDEAVAAFDIEPFHDSGYFLGNHLFLLVLRFYRGLVRTAVDVCHVGLAIFGVFLII